MRLYSRKGDNKYLFSNYRYQSMNKNVKKINDLLNDDSFLRWVKKSASGAEQAEWENWLQSDPEHSQLLQSALKYLNLPFQETFRSETEIGEQLFTLNERIDEFEELSKRRSNVLIHYKDTRKYQFLKYAAAAVIALTIGILALNQKSQFSEKTKKIAYQSIHVPYGKHEILKLADGSEIILNANSDLRYPTETFGNKPLNVWLKGEAYFFIVHNPNGKNRVFQVHTDEGVVKDLGTRFVVNARNQTTKVVLVEGQVAVASNPLIGNDAKYIKMMPGEMANFTASTLNMNLKQVNTDVYTSWIHNKLVFDNTPVTEAIQIIENYYGVKIIVTDKKTTKEKISGTIRNTNLDTVVKGLCKILGLKAEHKNNIILLNK